MFEKMKNDHPLDQARKANEGFFKGLYDNLRLIVRLLKDERVNTLLKLLPIGALIYLVVPVDFLPINPIDDGLVVWLGGYLFIEFCPDDVVEEHRKALRQLKDIDVTTEEPSSEVIDGSFRDVSSEDK
ncbi:MAG: hypothetical protein U9R53_00860 [Chloroflexota bacterium]|nr:hypothetical protein [Chloroflexota bacterium]